MNGASEFWEQLIDFKGDTLRIDSLWLRIHDAAPSKMLLRFVAAGSWQCLGHGIEACGPDGMLSLRLHPDCLLAPTAASGALIGKLGGSSAGRDDGKVFPIGSFCVYPPLDKPAPLFIAVNGASAIGGYQIDRLQLVVSTSDQSQDGA